MAVVSPTPFQAALAAWPAALPSARAAAYIGFSPKTLANWRATGDGPPYVRLGKSGARIVYRVSDLDEFLSDHVIGSSR